jgi:hypothetical protein
MVKTLGNLRLITHSSGVHVEYKDRDVFMLAKGTWHTWIGIFNYQLWYTFKDARAGTSMFTFRKRRVK